MLTTKVIFILAVLAAFGSVARAQDPAGTPPAESQVTVATEEVKVNVTVRDANGRFVPDLRKEELVVMEDDRLQQPNSLRRSPASVLLLLDTGGAMRARLSATREAAKRLAGRLAAEDRVAVMQFGGSAELLLGWTGDKASVSEVLDKKLGFGTRSDLERGLREAVAFMEAEPAENRHIVLVTGGIDGAVGDAGKESIAERLAGTDINVHVVSFTALESGAASSQKAIFREGEFKPRRMPEEIVETLPDPKGPGKKKEPTPRDVAKAPRLAGVTLDIPRVMKGRAAAKQLKETQQFLEALAADGNGIFLLPASVEELAEGAESLADTIDSQYVLAYTPKRPLKESPRGEVRHIRVTSRRAGVLADAQRKLTVVPRH